VGGFGGEWLGREVEGVLEIGGMMFLGKWGENIIGGSVS
jgi:hypothetical protein